MVFGSQLIVRPHIGGAQYGERRGCVERQPAGERFVGDDGERVLIAGLTWFCAVGHLRIEVAGGTEGEVGIGEAGVGGVAGDAEVGQQRQIVRCEQHVLGLDVAMQDAFAMRGIEGLRNGRKHGRSLVGRERPARDALGQCAVWRIRHDDGDPVTVIDHLEDANDVRMVEAGQRLRFAAKAVAFLVASERPHPLDRHLAIDPTDRPRQVHRTHCPVPEQSFEPVPRHDLRFAACHSRHVLRS